MRRNDEGRVDDSQMATISGSMPASHRSIRFGIIPKTKFMLSYSSANVFISQSGHEYIRRNTKCSSNSAAGYARAWLCGRWSEVATRAPLGRD